MRFFSSKSKKKFDLILDAYDPEKEKKDHCDETPISEQTVYSLLPSENYSNENWIILRGQDNYEATSLQE